MTIDWNDFKDTYNKMHRTNFKAADEWITSLYNKHDKFVSPVACELGISFYPVKKYLRKLGIWERKSRGGNNYRNRPLGKKEVAFLNISKETMHDLTKYQICKRCLLSKDRCELLIRKHKRTFMKGYGDTTNEWT